MNQNRKAIALTTELVTDSYGLKEFFIGVGVFTYFGTILAAYFLFAGKYAPAGVGSVAVGFLLIGIAVCYLLYRISRSFFRRRLGYVEKLDKTAKSKFYSRSLLVALLVGFFLDFGYIGSDHTTVYRLAQNNTLFGLSLLFLAVLFGLFWWLRYREISNFPLGYSVILLISSLLIWTGAADLIVGNYIHGNLSEYVFLIYLTALGTGAILLGITNYLIVSKNLKPIARGEEVYESV